MAIKQNLNDKSLWELFIGFRDGNFFLQDCIHKIETDMIKLRHDRMKLIEYIYEFAWHYGRLYHIGDAEKIKAAISKKFMLPEEFLMNSNEPGAVSSHEAEKEVCDHPVDKVQVTSEGCYCNVCGEQVG